MYRCGLTVRRRLCDMTRPRRPILNRLEGFGIMKKLGVALILIGIILYAAAALLGIAVRDDAEIRSLSLSTGIAISPENAEQLYSHPQAKTLSGKPNWMLTVYRYIRPVSSIGIGSAALGLFLILLSLIFKPLISIALIVVIIGLCYFAAQGNLGPDIASFVQGVINAIRQLFTRAIDWVRSIPVNGLSF